MANIPKEFFNEFQEHLNKEQDLREVNSDKSIVISSSFIFSLFKVMSNSLVIWIDI